MLCSSMLVINVPAPTPPLGPICKGELAVVNVEPLEELVAHLKVGGVSDKPEEGFPAGMEVSKPVIKLVGIHSKISLLLITS